jgi:xanthine dehydrogenase molybdopterin-binding subunit B
MNIPLDYHCHSTCWRKLETFNAKSGGNPLYTGQPVTSRVAFFYGNAFFLRKVGNFDTRWLTKYGKLPFSVTGAPQGIFATMWIHGKISFSWSRKTKDFCKRRFYRQRLHFPYFCFMEKIDFHDLSQSRNKRQDSLCLGFKEEISDISWS